MQRLQLPSHDADEVAFWQNGPAAAGARKLRIELKEMEVTKREQDTNVDEATHTAESGTCDIPAAGSIRAQKWPWRRWPRYRLQFVRHTSHVKHHNSHATCHDSHITPRHEKPGINCLKTPNFTTLPTTNCSKSGKASDALADDDNESDSSEDDEAKSNTKDNG